MSEVLDKPPAEEGDDSENTPKGAEEVRRDDIADAPDDDQEEKDEPEPN